MHDYINMTAEERFRAVDRLAIQLFGTDRWKTEFSRRYDMTPQAVNRWRNNGAPVWPLVALTDALKARKWDDVRSAVLADDA